MIKTEWSEKIGYGFLILLLAIFPAYSALINGSGHQHLEHHLDFLAGHSVYFNPWQYRVLSPFLVELFHQFLAHSVYKFLPVSDQYNTSFKLFRIGQHLVLMSSCWFFYRHFSPNRPLRLIGLVFMAAAFSFAAYRSDFAFNTYFDIIFYVWGAWLIFSGGNRWLFIPLTIVAALNRETSLLLPFLLFLDFLPKPDSRILKRNLLIFSGCLLLYFAIFLYIRTYYGFQPPAPIGLQPGWEMLLFNLTDPVTLLKLGATLGILPLLALLTLKKADVRLQYLFWGLVPVWVGAHICLVWARETRLFLVPVVVVLLPVILTALQKELQETTVQPILPPKTGVL